MKTIKFQISSDIESYGDGWDGIDVVNNYYDYVLEFLTNKYGSDHEITVEISQYTGENVTIADLDGNDIDPLYYGIDSNEIWQQFCNQQ